MKKLLCTILAAAMLSPCAAYAREWVHVSEWAYNDVSVFTSEGLLTERFDSISDYRRNIQERNSPSFYAPFLSKPTL